VDRLVAQFVGAGSLRDVIAFPKTTAARALYEGAPSPVTATDLSGLGLSLGTTLQQSEVRRETE
jgi:aspartyl-tRNA synthetase